MDIEIILLFQQFRDACGGFFDKFAIFLASVSVDFYMVVPALILFWVYNKKKGMLALSSYGTAIFTGAFLKGTFCVYRPWIRDARVKPLKEVLGNASGYSFPSGHSTSTSGFYSGIISGFRKYKPLCIMCGFMILLTMFSRLYLGVHTPQDVIVGGAIGILAAIVMTFVLKLADKYKNADIIILIVSLLLVAAVLIYFSLKSYPVDYVDGKVIVDPKKMMVDGYKDPGVFFGIILGWFIERRFVKFDISGTTYQKFMRCFVGGLLYIIYELSVVASVGKFFNIGIVYFILKMSEPLLFMTVYPLIFKAVEKASDRKKAKAAA